MEKTNGNVGVGHVGLFGGGRLEIICPDHVFHYFCSEQIGEHNNACLDRHRHRQPYPPPPTGS